ncbi:hypothetical protein AYO44_06445 [Planctomycetaceae bacterium SCGC AG-212-F19]|nr:hypothetical protein AYO44_06445 [Planctomycetaceae bacterium SCGC AG-212-F19]
MIDPKHAIHASGPVGLDARLQAEVPLPQIPMVPDREIDSPRLRPFRYLWALGPMLLGMVVPLATLRAEPVGYQLIYAPVTSPLFYCPGIPQKVPIGDFNIVFATGTILHTFHYSDAGEGQRMLWAWRIITLWCGAGIGLFLAYRLDRWRRTPARARPSAWPLLYVPLFVIGAIVLGAWLEDLWLRLGALASGLGLAWLAMGLTRKVPRGHALVWVYLLCGLVCGALPGLLGVVGVHVTDGNRVSATPPGGMKGCLMDPDATVDRTISLYVATVPVFELTTTIPCIQRGSDYGKRERDRAVDRFLWTALASLPAFFLGAVGGWFVFRKSTIAHCGDPAFWALAWVAGWLDRYER